MLHGVAKILKSYNNQQYGTDGRINRSIEQERVPRNRSTEIESTDL